MRPQFNSPPFRPASAPPVAAAPPTQQGISNNCQAKPPSLFPNSQVQPQMGMHNPQASNPFNGPNNMPQPNGTPSVQQVPPNWQGNQQNMFPNSQFQPQMGMLNPQMPMLFNNFNTSMLNGCVPMLVNPQNGFMMPINTNQPFNQVFSPNCINTIPMFQNAGFPMQNMNQFVQRPLSNFNQAGPCNATVYPNQVPQVLGAQNPNFNQNAHFVMVPANVAMPPSGQNLPNLVNSTAQLAQVKSIVQPNLQLTPPQQAQNGFRPPVSNTSQVPPQQAQNGFRPPVSNTSQVPPQQTQNGFRPPVSNLSQAPPQQAQNGVYPRVSNTSQAPPQQAQNGFRPQGSFGNSNGNSPQGKWKNHQNRDFKKNPNRDGLQQGFQKNKNMNKAKGYQGQAGQKPNFTNSMNQSPVLQKTLSLNYTANEIQQWREQRKKNHPSNSNIKKKEGGNVTESEENNRIAKLRRQQLKEVLEKQAKLGCEVAEIPSHYLDDSENQPNGEKENTKAFGKRDKFQNKSNKRGKPRRNNDRFSKKQKLREEESSNTHDQNGKQLPLTKREPTLLQKLLSADVRRDKARLLQVFRFMVMNSFFKDWPQTPLAFPLVMVKEDGAQSEVLEQKPVLENDVFKIKIKGEGDDDTLDSSGSLKCIFEGKNEGEEEEGEIVD